MTPPSLPPSTGGWRRVAALVLAVLVMLAGDAVPLAWATPTPALGSLGSSPQAPPDQRSPREEYDGVLASEAALIDQLDAAARRVDDLEAETAELDRRVAQAMVDVASAEAAVEQAVAIEERTTADAEAAAERLDQATTELREQAVESYVRGGRGATEVEALISVMDDVEDAATTLTYADAVVDHQQALVDELRAARTARDARVVDARSARAEAAEARDIADLARAGLEGERAAKADLAEETRAEEASYGILLYELQGLKAEILARIAAQEAESARIAAALALQQAAQQAAEVQAPRPPAPSAEGPPAPSGEGPPRSGATAFVDPLPGHPTGSPYGWRLHPILGYQRLHTGIDIPAPSGTPILAAAEGVVLSAGPRGGYGNAVVIDHGSSVATLYAHLSDIDVGTVRAVAAGDAIGEVGSTGLSTGPHLHLEVRVGGTPVDPAGYIDR